MLYDKDLENAIEAVLFVSTDAITEKFLSDIFNCESREIKCALQNLKDKYDNNNGGIILKQIAGGWRFFSNPIYHEIIEKYILSLDPRKLSTAALETLAIIAYNQPVTRAGVSSVRGVNSDSSVSSLVEKGLVKESGVADSPGNPILYSITNKFLENFGLNSIDELPNLDDFAPDEETKQFIAERLSNTHFEQLENSDFNDKNDIKQKNSKNNDNNVADAKEIFESALSGAFGVTEKIDFDKLKFNTDDE